MNASRLAILTSTLLCLGLAAGCAVYENSGNSGARLTFEGTLSGTGGESGRFDLELVLASAEEFDWDQWNLHGTATGSIEFLDGRNIELEGSFDSQDGIELSGQGYVFTGPLSKDILEGEYTGPNSRGTYSTMSTKSGQVIVYCGTFAGDESGTWNLVRRGNELSGSYTGEMVGPGWLSGSMDKDQLSLTHMYGTAEGVLSATSLSGTWEAAEEAAQGTWEGSTSGCE